jgi:hypothetical protein
LEVAETSVGVQLHSGSKQTWAVEASARLDIEGELYEPATSPVVVGPGESAVLAVDLSSWESELIGLAAPARLQIHGTMSAGDVTRRFALDEINVHRPAAGDPMLVYGDETKKELFAAGDLDEKAGTLPPDPDAPDDSPVLDDFGIGREVDLEGEG